MLRKEAIQNNMRKCIFSISDLLDLLDFCRIVTRLVLVVRDLYKEIHRNMLSIRDLLDVWTFVEFSLSFY